MLHPLALAHTLPALVLLLLLLAPAPLLAHPLPSFLADLVTLSPLHRPAPHTPYVSWRHRARAVADTHEHRLVGLAAGAAAAAVVTPIAAAATANPITGGLIGGVAGGVVMAEATQASRRTAQHRGIIEVPTSLRHARALVQEHVRHATVPVLAGAAGGVLGGVLGLGVAGGTASVVAKTAGHETLPAVGIDGDLGVDALHISTLGVLR